MVFFFSLWDVLLAKRSSVAPALAPLSSHRSLGKCIPQRVIWTSAVSPTCNILKGELHSRRGIAINNTQRSRVLSS